MKFAWQAGFLALTLAGTASAQSVLERIVVLQEARIQQLELSLKAASQPCGEYGEVVYNSVANPAGSKVTGSLNTRQFWNISYADRFGTKGQLTKDLVRNYYNGGLYKRGPAIYTDLIEDLNGKVAVAFQAKSDGIDEKTMRFINPTKLSGHEGIYKEHFAGGWASPDADFDDYGPKNCATDFGSTQHYGGCWIYNLGSDADSPQADEDWGPHVHTTLLGQFLPSPGNDGTTYTRVNRITRCAKPIH